MTFNVNKIEDDEAPFMETMTKRLSKRDLKIITAFSGEEALERPNKNEPVYRNYIFVKIN